MSFTVALIGPDGAGKSSIARRLESSFPLPVKRLYMGINTESSNVALPTTRLIERLRQARRRRSGAVRSATSPAAGASRKPAGKLWAAVRLANRLAEEWYRQLLSWSYRLRGKIVVYDRHFKFDFEWEKGRQRRFSDRLHRWFLAKCYPQPDLVIYLDAPAEVLFARKGEANLQWLEERRQAFLRQGAKMPGFVRVDATQSLEAVHAEVRERILEFRNTPAKMKRAGAGLLGRWFGQLSNGVAREWNTTRGWSLLLLAMPFMMVLSGLVAAAAGRDVYVWFTGEDGFAEYLQVALYGASFLMSLLAARRLRTGGEKSIAALYLLLALGFFFLVGEELSWGQRIFGWTTPETLRQLNRQQESNLHNLYGVEGALKWVQLVVAGCGAFLPLLLLQGKVLVRYRDKLALLLPPPSLMHYFFFKFVWRAYRNLVPAPPHLAFFISEYTEVFELVLATGFFLFLVYQLRRIRPEPRAQFSDVEGFSAT